MKWRPAITNGSYSAPAPSSISAWNVTTTPVYFTQVTTGANVAVADGNFGSVHFDGITRDNQGVSPPQCLSSGYWKYGLVTWWNRFHTDSYSNAKRQSVMVHELGHALGLAHTPSTACSTLAIMYPGTDLRYDTCGWTTPRNDDIAWVNTLY